jgi:hypothetical protein
MRITFEEACKLSASICTADNVKKFGIADTMEKRRLALEEAGWTSDQLVDEAGKRSRSWLAAYHAT